MGSSIGFVSTAPSLHTLTGELPGHVKRSTRQNEHNTDEKMTSNDKYEEFCNGVDIFTLVDVIHGYKKREKGIHNAYLCEPTDRCCRINFSKVNNNKCVILIPQKAEFVDLAVIRADGHSEESNETK